MYMKVNTTTAAIYPLLKKILMVSNYIYIFLIILIRLKIKILNAHLNIREIQIISEIFLSDT